MKIGFTIFKQLWIQKFSLPMISKFKQTFGCRSDMADDYITESVCSINELEDNKIKPIKIGGIDALLIKSGVRIYATGAKCSHYNLPLANGVASGGHIRCPFHGACFNLKTGDIEDSPGLDGIPIYEAYVKGDEVIVKAKRSSLEESKVIKKMCPRSEKSKRLALIIGGGPAAASACESLRQNGFDGRIIVASKESYLPYDKPTLSKSFDVTPEKACLRTAEFYSNNNIEFQLKKEAVKLDYKRLCVDFKDGSNINFCYLILAVGTYPRVLSNIPGNDLKNIVTLRNLEDANYIASNVIDKDVLIVGSSFIGIEVATTLLGKAKSIVITSTTDVPFADSLGKDMGGAIKTFLEEKGLKFKKSTPKEFKGEDGVLTHVILQDETELPAQLCVLGIGVSPATEFLKDSGLKISDRGFIEVNKLMETNLRDVYAVGDAVSFPLFLVNDQLTNIQHIQMAEMQGRIAGINLAGKRKEIHSVPYFWTLFLGKGIRFTGYTYGYDDIFILGKLEELQFEVYYLKENKVVGLATMGTETNASKFAEIFLNEQIVTKSDLERNPLGWLSKIKAA